ncbi:MAG: ADP-ribosylglycohydrolase family protein [Planctomycetaceae bacterium]
MSDLQLERAMLSLEGLSLGDAFGQRFFFAWVLENATEENLPQGPWTFTDDTEMAIGLIQHLKAKRTVVQDELVRIFAERYIADPGRGYGEGAAKLRRPERRPGLANSCSLSVSWHWVIW